LGLHGSGAPGLINLVTLQPYFKAKFGPVSLEGELWYGFGSVKYEDNTFGEDIQISNWQAYLNAKADFGMVYVGGTFAWVSGDNPGTTDKAEGGFLGGGADFQPCLMMFNNDLNYWSGMNPKGYGPLSGIGYDQGYGQYSAMSNGGMQNAWLYQLKAGVRPVAKLDVNASVTYAYADQKPFINGGIPYYGISQAATSYSNSDYGWEIDVVATYKITNNLSYMLGGAYWIVGNYFKGSNANFLGPHGSDVSTDLNNDYMVINKLTLTF
jgi:hypothetical protein